MKIQPKGIGSSQQVKDSLKEKITGYSESLNVYPLIKDRISKAIKHAKKVEKEHIKNGQEIDSEEANPHTSAYKIVEELLKRNALE